MNSFQRRVGQFEREVDSFHRPADSFQRMWESARRRSKTILSHAEIVPARAGDRPDAVRQSFLRSQKLSQRTEESSHRAHEIVHLSTGTFRSRSHCSWAPPIGPSVLALAGAPQAGIGRPLTSVFRLRLFYFLLSPFAPRFLAWHTDKSVCPLVSDQLRITDLLLHIRRDALE